MSRFSHEEPERWSELLEDALDARDRREEERRRTDLVSRMRIARLMADGPLRTESGE